MWQKLGTIPIFQNLTAEQIKELQTKQETTNTLDHTHDSQHRLSCRINQLNMQGHAVSKGK